MQCLGRQAAATEFVSCHDLRDENTVAEGGAGGGAAVPIVVLALLGGKKKCC